MKSIRKCIMIVWLKLYIAVFPHIFGKSACEAWLAQYNKRNRSGMV
jgi:hypothetical protein